MLFSWLEQRRRRMDWLLGQSQVGILFEAYSRRDALPSTLNKHTHSPTREERHTKSGERALIWTLNILVQKKKTWLSILATAKRVNIFSKLEKKVYFFSFCNFALITLILCTAWYFHIHLKLLKVTKNQKKIVLDERKIAIRFARV